MNRKLTIFISMALIFGMMAQIGMTVDSYPGFHSGSECSYCHNESASAANENMENATITLDGKLTEDYWVNYDGHRAEVQVATTFGGVHEFIAVYFYQNTTHLFVAMSWSIESRTVVSNGTNFDGAAIMFNVDSEDMSFSTTDGMMIRDVDGTADMWFYEAPEDDNGKNNTQLTGAVNDYSVGDGGWDKTETQDVMAGVAHSVAISRGSVRTSMSIEFARKLTTAETDVDTQFKYNNYHDFAIAIWDEASGDDHWMSFVHSVFVAGEDGADPLNPIDIDYKKETKTETKTEVITSTGAGATITEAGATVTVSENQSETPFLFGFFGVSLFSIVGVMIYTRRRN